MNTKFEYLSLSLMLIVLIMAIVIGVFTLSTIHKMQLTIDLQQSRIKQLSENIDFRLNTTRDNIENQDILIKQVNTEMSTLNNDMDKLWQDFNQFTIPFSQIMGEIQAEYESRGN